MPNPGQQESLDFSGSRIYRCQNILLCKKNKNLWYWLGRRVSRHGKTCRTAMQRPGFDSRNVPLLTVKYLFLFIDYFVECCLRPWRRCFVHRWASLLKKVTITSLKNPKKIMIISLLVTCPPKKVSINSLLVTVP
jgi:hypothetical protein